MFIVVLMFILIFSPITYAQTDYIKAEAYYLSLVNKQNNKALIQDNLRNAQLVADSIVFKYLSDQYSDDVLANITQSYYLTDQWQMAYLSGLEYMLFFKDSDQVQLVKYILQIAAKHLKVNVEQVFEQVQDLKDFDSKIVFLIRQAVELKSRKCDQFTWNLINLAKSAGIKLPFWAVLWQYFYEIGIPPKARYKLIDFNLEDYTSIENYVRTLSFCKRLYIRLKRCIF